MTGQTAHGDAEQSGEGGASAWTFRGYRLDQAHFTTAMVHFYRGEMARANVWRTRLDATTNWAVITVGAMLTFVFGAPQHPHFMLLLAFLLVLTFLYLEARRYRYYALWAYRVRLMETDFFAAMLAPPFHPSSDWADHLVESLLQPVFPIAWWEAIGRRFRRNYVWLIALLLVSWWAKLTIHPQLSLNVGAVVERAAVGSVPGVWVMSVVGAVCGTLVVLAVASSLPLSWWKAVPRSLRRLGEWVWRAAGPSSLRPAPREQLATIITSRGQQVASLLLTELGRGVTELKGTGMYTGEKRSVLLCAVTDVQVSHLEEIACRADPKAFVIVSPAGEVRGWGFRPFEPPG